MATKDLSARIADLYIEPAIMNASGILPYPSMLKRISRYDIGAVVTKTTGAEERPGNESPVFARCSDGVYVNAVGLPDPGYKQIIEEIKTSRPFEKPLIVSLSARTEEEMAMLVEELENFGNALELNYSCPNIRPGEKVGVTIGNDPEKVYSFTKAARGSTKKPVIPKLGPGPYIFDRNLFIEMADAAIKAGADALTLINTVPGGMKIDIRARRPVLSAGYGGVSGKAIKPIAVGCVYAARDRFPEIPIIGCGGIDDEEDVIEFFEAGADAVQIGTTLGGKGTDEIGTYLAGIVRKLEERMEELGVVSLRELRSVAHAPR